MASVFFYSAIQGSDFYAQPEIEVHNSRRPFDHHHHHHHKCLVPGVQQTGSAWQYKSQYNKKQKING